jgi:hypothetical protein
VIRARDCDAALEKQFLRPARAGRYVQEFYTSVKTAYTFDGNQPYVPKAKASE